MISELNIQPERLAAKCFGEFQLALSWPMTPRTPKKSLTALEEDGLFINMIYVNVIFSGQKHITKRDGAFWILESNSASID